MSELTFEQEQRLAQALENVMRIRFELMYEKTIEKDASFEMLHGIYLSQYVDLAWRVWQAAFEDMGEYLEWKRKS